MRLPPRLLLWAAPIPLLATVLVRGGDSPGLMAGDYAHYLLHARAIVEGHAYTDVGFLYSEYNPFIGPKAQPPGLPLALAGAFVLFGENEMIATLLVFATGIGFLLLVGHYFFRREEPWLGIGVALMSGLSLRFVHHSSQVLSDVPFAMLIWSVIIVADRPEQWTWRRTAAIAGLGVAAILVRLAGVPLVLAMVIFAALHFRQHGLRPLVPAAVWIAAFLIISRAIPVSAAVASEVSFGPMEMLRMTLTNIRNYSLTVPESHLYPFPWDRVNDIYHVIAFAIMLVGLIANAITW